MDITLLPPTSILANHSHLSSLASLGHLSQPSLLPSALPRHTNSRRPCFVKGPFDEFWSPRAPSCYNGRLLRAYSPRPPRDGSSPLLGLPDEVLLSIFSHLDLEDVLSLRETCCRFSRLSLAPSLHRSLTLTTLPPSSSPLPPLLCAYLLPAVRHLHLHLFPYPLRNPSSHVPPPAPLLSLLWQIPPDQLLSLSLPFSAPYLSLEDLCSALQRVGRRLRHLDLRGSALSGQSWVSSFGTMEQLHHLDLGFTNISSLPTFCKLQSLSLASCPSLPARTLKRFLNDLPSTLRRLDLSRLDQIPFDALWHMRVTHEMDGVVRPTNLREVKVVGIDHLTRRDVRGLKKHWEEQRWDCLPSRAKTNEYGQGQGTKPLPISSQPCVRSSSSSSSDGKSTHYLLDTPQTPESFAGSPSSSTSSRSSLSPSTPATSLGSPSPPSLPHRHPFLSSLSQSPLPSYSHPLSFDKDLEGQEGTIGINIVHSAILESEDEDGYRRFIGEVAGATVGWDETDRGGEGGGGYVEIDD